MLNFSNAQTYRGIAKRTAKLVCEPASYQTAWGIHNMPAYHMRFDQPDKEEAKKYPYYGCDLKEFIETYTDSKDGQGYIKKTTVTAYQVTEDTEVPTLEGTEIAHPGDYIVRASTGKVWPVTKDTFENTYALV